MSDYQITDSDIDAMMRYLEIYHPENANREYAQGLLEHTKSALHEIAKNNPDDIEAMYEVYEQSLKDTSS